MKRSDLNKLVLEDIRSRMFLAKYGRMPRRHADSLTSKPLTKKQARLVRQIADRAIRMHDADLVLSRPVGHSGYSQHQDVIGIAIFSGTFLKLILPLLGSFLIKSVGAGVANSVAMTLKENVVGPLVKKIIERGKALAASKGKDETYTQAIIQGIKEDMNKLVAILSKEKSFIGQKIVGLWNKIRNVA